MIQLASFILHLSYRTVILNHLNHFMIVRQRVGAVCKLYNTLAYRRSIRAMHIIKCYPHKPHEWRDCRVGDEFGPQPCRDDLVSLVWLDGFGRATRPNAFVRYRMTERAAAGSN